MSESRYPFERGQFLCTDKECNKLFYASRDEGEIFEEDGDFFAKCPGCSMDAIEPHYMKNLHSTVGTAKGANMSEEARKKTRLNGFKTGSSLLSKYHEGKIPMPPAKPDKYQECDGCQDIETCKDNVEAQKGTGVPVFCHRKGEVMMKHAAAFLSGDPEQLKMMAAMNTAQMQQVLNNSFKEIFERGTEVIEKIVHTNKEGVIDSITEKIYAHPLIKQCTTIMQMMGYSLTDWTMTPKSKEAKEQVAGFLAASMGSGASLEEVTEKIKATVHNFSAALGKAAALRDQADTLKVFEEEQGEREKEL